MKPLSLQMRMNLSRRIHLKQVELVIVIFFLYMVRLFYY